MAAKAAKENFRQLAFWVCTIVIMVLCLVPTVPREIPDTGWDKSNHVLAFVVLGLLAHAAYGRLRAVHFAGLVGYGGLIEILQSLTPARAAEWEDLLADAIGVLLAWGIAAALRMRPPNYPIGFVLSMPRMAKRLVVLCVDAILCLLTVWMALSLRLGSCVSLTQPYWVAIAMSMVLALPIFGVFGLYRAIFRYSGPAAVTAIWHAAMIYSILYVVAIAAVGIDGVPRTVGFIQPAILLVAVAASRALAGHFLGGKFAKSVANRSAPRALIYGAGSAGQQLATALSNSLETRVVGFLDDDRKLHGGTISGLRVFDPENLAELVRERDVETILLAMPSMRRNRRNEILASILRAQVSVRTLPGLSDLAQGRVETSDLRELDIDDLLGRDPVPPNTILLAKNVVSKVVLVTGAGGSIGSELCRQILKIRPEVLLLVERSEFALYAIHGELQQLLMQVASGVAPRVVPLLASVGDERRMREIMLTWRPHTVYHAAAYKHVPMVEHNPAEGVENNVFGTLVTARAAIESKVNDFVLVSTDKAVRPTNVMGTTKRVAEMALQALAAQVDASPAGTRLCMVRFGNVLGSSGSVVPLFRKQIKDGGPITLTHADMTRYFMTIPEAAQLVIQAGAMASGGDVFVLDMGEPVKIIDLARRMVELSGLSVQDAENPEGDIAVRITGLRPGEKLYEELLIGGDPLPTRHPRIMKAHEEFLPLEQLNVHLSGLRNAIEVNDVVAMRKLLQSIVLGYRPESEVVDWVHMEQCACQERLLKRAVA